MARTATSTRRTTTTRARTGGRTTMTGRSARGGAPSNSRYLQLAAKAKAKVDKGEQLVVEGREQLRMAIGQARTHGVPAKDLAAELGVTPTTISRLSKTT